MTQYVYHPEGRPHGFVLGKYVYGLDGRAVGRISGTRVYLANGSYVGELFQDMLVEKPVGARRPLKPVTMPEDVVPPGNIESRRPLACQYPDAFHRLLCREP